MGKTLEGIRVLDLASYIAGPFCCMLLADHGAEVIRVEPPGGKVDRETGPFLPNGLAATYGFSIQRNKRNITLDFKTANGRRLLDELVAKTDVVVHNFPPGTVEATLLEYDRLSAVNPALIVAAVSGFGQTGPYARRSCFDAVAQAMSGAMSITGYPGTPPLKDGVTFVDFQTAARTAFGVMLALYERRTSGRGQLVDIALFDGAMSMMVSLGCAAEYRLLGEVRKPVGNCGFYAYVGSRRARDGYISINIVGNGQWRRMCRVMGREDLLGDPRFRDNLNRFRHYPDVDAVLDEWIGDKTVAEALEILQQANIPSGPVNDIPAALSEPQVEAREMIVDLDCPGVGKAPVAGVCIKLSRTPGSVDRRASLLGEDNGAIYSGLLGYGPDDLARLQQEKTI